jgi:N-acetylglucosaminyldiphosphoundecaprenol N-acetyl-beta-D-mannosaminyltransferase
MGIPIDNVTLPQAVEAIVDALDSPADSNFEGAEPKQVSFVNADCVNLAFVRADYRRALIESDMVFADGIGVRLAGEVLGQKVLDNVNGTDLFPILAAALEYTGKKIYLMGGKPNVAESVALWLVQRFPGLEIAGFRDGYFSADEEEQVVEEIRNSGANLVLVALGAPRQELWIRRNLSRLGVKVAIGVGGLFDFFSGRIPRAPLWMRKAGLEWAYRLYQEPKRLWRRYLLGNPLFLVRLLRFRVFSFK